MDKSISEEDIKSAFQKYGQIERVDIKTDKYTQVRLGYGFIYFTSSAPVDTILEKSEYIV